MIDLGYKSEPPETTSSPEAPKVQYPSFDLRDENADKLKEETGHECQVDDVYTATVQLRVSGVRSDEYGKSITFDVVSIDDVEPEGSAGDEADESDDSMSGDSADGGSKTPKKMPKALRYS